MKIKDATLDDTGIYMCKGTNGFGSQDARIDLIVIGKTQTCYKHTKMNTVLLGSYNVISVLRVGNNLNKFESLLL